MAQSNLERVGRALELLTQGLQPLVEREMKAIDANTWMDRTQEVLREDRSIASAFHWEPQTVLLVMWNHRHIVFKQVLFMFQLMVGIRGNVANHCDHSRPEVSQSHSDLPLTQQSLFDGGREGNKTRATHPQPFQKTL